MPDEYMIWIDLAGANWILDTIPKKWWLKLHRSMLRLLRNEKPMRWVN